MPGPDRFDRLISTGSARRSPLTDRRTPGQKDRDRILYTSAFRRLAGVTQVVGPLEGHIFHNRLTHTLEVAQIARRLAERLCATQSDEARAAGGIDVDVVEAAALAHDLGHPPFGHVAEDELDALAIAGTPDGFEGNAQSFRILTKLATHREGYGGLNLTRATLNAVLKYPWHRRDADPKKPKKFGAYNEEHAELAFAREGMANGDRAQSVEASIMDHADDIAYSVHDVDDFYRAGLIPLETIRDRFEHFVDQLRGSKRVTVLSADIDRHMTELREMINWMPDERFDGTFDDRGEQRTRTSRLIERFISAARLAERDGRVVLDVPSDIRVQMKFLQNLVWEFVIDNPRLATQQRGQREVIRRLFEVYGNAIEERHAALVPATFRDELDQLGDRSNSDSAITARGVRLAVDIVASFTDSQAVALHRRLNGTSLGSLMDILDR